MNAVPAKRGTDPNASFNSRYSSGVMVEASLTKALCGLQDVPKIKSNKFA